MARQLNRAKDTSIDAAPSRSRSDRRNVTASKRTLATSQNWSAIARGTSCQSRAANERFVADAR
jgi:hypothetical protein